MSYDMLSNGIGFTSNRPGEVYDMSVNYGAYKSINAQSNPFQGRPHTLTLAELEFELRYRGDMIANQQRKIMVLEEELKRTRSQMEMMSTQLSNFEQERLKEKKKPQSRYWTPEEHERFIEALTKFGHKDVKSISQFVSTRNATQVRTHAQKYFLRLEREKRKIEDGPREGDFDEYVSSDMEDTLSPDPGSPMDDSPTASTTPVPTPINSLRKRASSFIITPAQAKVSVEHRDVVLAGLPSSWTHEDYDQFIKGLIAYSDKQDMDLLSMCRAIYENFLSHHSVDEVEMCYRQLQKCVRQKALSVSSPKRRRASSKPELPSSSLSSSPVNFNSSGLASFSSNNPGFHSLPFSAFQTGPSMTPIALARSSNTAIHRLPANMHLTSMPGEFEIPILEVPAGFAFTFNPFNDAQTQASLGMTLPPNP